MSNSNYPEEHPAPDWPPETAHEKKIYSQAELDQAIKEAGFSTEIHRLLLSRALSTITQMERIHGRTNRSTQWVNDYKAFDAE